jgi:hypothetical protein
MKKYQASTKYKLFRFLIWSALLPDGWDHLKKKWVHYKGKGLFGAGKQGDFLQITFPSWTPSKMKIYQPPLTTMLILVTILDFK